MDRSSASTHVETTVGTWVKLGLFVVLLTAGGAVLLFVPLPTAEEVHAWVAAGGAWVPLTFIGAYAVATLLPIPKNVLSAAAGLAFGLPLGTSLVWLAAMIGAAVSFGLGRVLGRGGIRRLAGVRLEKLDALVLKHGLVAVLIARLIPVVPFTAVNYGSGLTAVRFPAYLLATGSASCRAPSPTWPLARMGPIPAVGRSCWPSVHSWC